ncbi:hypothetical protein QE152_g18920 [Popillia japonica]|uniref:Reverse transcriptase n=1 Tax=Popillia japonica TaxID=7064 RepID=A0AAW1KZE1_POPJA
MSECLRILLHDLLQKNLIRPSSSECSSPIVLVLKSNKDLRMCIDHQALNDQTLKESVRFSQEEILHKFGSEKWGLPYGHGSKFEIKLNTLILWDLTKIKIALWSCK